MIEVTVRKYMKIEGGDFDLDLVPSISGWLVDGDKFDLKQLVEAVEDIVRTEPSITSHFGGAIRPMAQEEAEEFKRGEAEDEE